MSRSRKKKKEKQNNFLRYGWNSSTSIGYKTFELSKHLKKETRKLDKPQSKYTRNSMPSKINKGIPMYQQGHGK